MAAASNFSPGFLPSHYQGTLFRNQGDPILYLSNPAGISQQTQRANLDLISDLNRMHHADTADMEILSRIASYELAFNMQMEAPELMDFSDESQETIEMYGIESDNEHRRQYATNCLLARRLVERGVRFVLMMDASWDDHVEINKNLPPRMEETDQPHGGVDQRPQTARPARRDTHCLGRRVWPDADGRDSKAGRFLQRWSRPPSERFQHVDGRRRHSGRPRPREDRRPVPPRD